jgi:FAD/FMN-containing dehydrogenase
MLEIGADEFGADLTRAVLEDSRLLLSRRDDVAIAYLAYLQYRTFPPDLLVLTQEQVDKILADEDRDIHDIAPAEWGRAQIFLPHGEGHDQWQLAEQLRDSKREAVALAAVHRAAEELAAEFQDVVVLAFDYEVEDEQLADALDRILDPGAPLRAFL